MSRTARLVATAALVTALATPLTSCAQVPSSTHKTVEPVVSEAVGNTGVKRMTLTDKAVERLALTTAPVADAGGGKLTVPYAALLYLPDGSTFVYTNPEGSSYLRAPITVEAITGDQVVLTAGPTPGTKVVTAGGAELWGAEFGIK